MSTDSPVAGTAPDDTAALPLLSEEAFRQHLATLEGAPHWLLERKQEAWERASALPYPKRTDESWRFASVGNLALEGYELPGGRDKALAERLAGSNHIEAFAGKSVFSDGFLLNHFEAADALKKNGVLWCPLHEAFRQHGDILEEAFAKHSTGLGSDKFEALHTALTASGTFLYVPDGVEIDEPFLGYHWATRAHGAVLPHTLVVTGKHARATVIDFYGSAEADTPHVALAAANVIAGEGAHVRYKTVQNWNEKSLGFLHGTVEAGKAADVTTLAVHTGCEHHRHEQTTRIVGEEARVQMYSLSVGTDKQELDQRTLQIHQAPHAYSDLLFKNALLDEARSIFSGLIRVDEGAQQTDAYQTNRNLMLSEDAEANSLPGLEIEANDVKCSHGATTGRVSAEELFYLRARGIPTRKAYELLVFGFFEEILGKIDNEPLADYARHLVQQKFHV